MSGEQTKSGLRHAGAERKRELVAAVIDWGMAGLNRPQARAIAQAFNAKINQPPLSAERFNEVFRAAWASVQNTRVSVGDGTQPSQLEDELFGSLEDVVATKPKFLWYPWIVKGAINFVEGMPEKGKSFLTMKIAAEMSKGGELPGEPELANGRVLVLDPEDDPSCTVKPRLAAMGADVSRIRYGKRDFDFNEDNLQALKAQIVRHKIDLVVIDPLNSFIPGVDIHRDNQVRGILGRLNEICQSTGCTMIAVRHHTKAKTGDPLTRGLGSIGFSAYARSVVLVGEDPSDPELAAVAHVKMNLAKKGKTLTFALTGGDGRTGKMPQFEWCGESEASAYDVAEGPRRDVGRPAEQSRDAHDFLERELASGAKTVKALNSLAERRNVASARTLRRVASEMGLKHTTVDGDKAWKLPAKKAA